MKKIINLLICILLTISINAQNDNIVSHQYTFSFGEMRLADTYLSNQEYSGYTYKLGARQGAFYSAENQNVSWEVYEKAAYGRLINASYSALIYYYSLNLGYASYYHWRPIENLTLSAGGAVDVFGAYKDQSRNVNNIASGDLQLQAKAIAAAQYSLQWKNFALNLQYSASTPFLGGMFVPGMGQSYYDIYLHLPEVLSDIVHFTSFHNNLGLEGNFSVNMIFKNFTLYTGFTHNNQKWSANNLNFYTNELSGYIGTTIDIIYKCGRNSQPHNSTLF